jgi:hypothetical protein
MEGEQYEADEQNEESFSVEYVPGTVFVNVYEVDRIYGGPEEGGWWYDAGRCVLSRQVAEESADLLMAELESRYPNTGKSSSVLYSGGDYRIWAEDEPGKDYPEVAPHYE